MPNSEPSYAKFMNLHHVNRLPSGTSSPPLTQQLAGPSYLDTNYVQHFTSRHALTAAPAGKREEGPLESCKHLSLLHRRSHYHLHLPKSTVAMVFLRNVHVYDSHWKPKHPRPLRENREVKRGVDKQGEESGEGKPSLPLFSPGSCR